MSSLPYLHLPETHTPLSRAPDPFTQLPLKQTKTPRLGMQCGGGGGCHTRRDTHVIPGSEQGCKKSTQGQETEFI